MILYNTVHIHGWKQSNTIKETLSPSVRSSHLTSKWRIWRSGTLVTKGETLSDQMEGPKIYSQKIFLSKIFSPKIFSSKIFSPKMFLSKIFLKKYTNYFWMFCQKYFQKNIPPQIFPEKYFHKTYFRKNTFDNNISEKRWGQSPLAARRA